VRLNARIVIQFPDPIKKCKELRINTIPQPLVINKCLLIEGLNIFRPVKLRGGQSFAMFRLEPGAEGTVFRNFEFVQLNQRAPLIELRCGGHAPFTIVYNTLEEYLDDGWRFSGEEEEIYNVIIRAGSRES
jgi:hypothetical protein